MTGLEVVRTTPATVGDFERTLTEAALAGEGWPEILARLRAGTGRHCRLVDVAGRLLAATDDGVGLSTQQARDLIRASHDPRHEPECPVAAPDGWRARVVGVEADERHGVLLLIAQPVTTREFELARGAVTAIRIESVRREAVGTPPSERGAALISALRCGRADAHELGLAAARRGMDPADLRCAAVLRYAGPLHRTWATALTWLDRPVQPAGDLAHTLVADAAALVALRARLDLAVGSGTVRAACGSPGPDGGYAQSFREAELLLATLAEGADTELSFDGSGMLQLLLAVPGERLRYFVDRHLGPLVDRPALLKTLRCWLDSGGSRQVVSAQLHLHRNTVGYRVGQLKSILGIDPLEPRHRAVLHAALEAHRLVENRSRGPVSGLTAADAHS